MKITEPGIYDLEINRYHNDPNLFDGPSISSTGLRTLIQRSPAHLFASSRALNPNADPVSTKSLTFGKAAHLRMMGDDRFLKHFAILPFPDLRTKAAKEWVAENEAAGLDIIRQDDLQTIDGMVVALRQHPAVRQGGLLAGEVEKSICWKDRETGIWLKVRPDVIPLDNVIADYKTCEDARIRKLRWSVEDYGYHQQMALIGEGFEEALGRTIEDYILAFQEKKAPFVVNPIVLDADYIAWGRVLNRKAIRMFADCVERNEWPGYPEEAHPIGPRISYVESLTERQEAGELPTFLEVGIRTTSDQTEEREHVFNEGG